MRQFLRYLVASAAASCLVVATASTAQAKTLSTKFVRTGRAHVATPVAGHRTHLLASPTAKRIAPSTKTLVSPHRRSAVPKHAPHPARTTYFGKTGKR